MSRAKRRPLQIVVQDGRPSAVILDMQDYIEMLERLDDMEDLEALDEMRRKPLEFRKLDEFLEEYSQGV